MHCTSKSLLTQIFRHTLHRPSTLPPSFLIPSITIALQTSPFSTTPIPQARKSRRRDRNPNRGISALRHTGLRRRQVLSVDLDSLPQPVLDPLKRSPIEIDENHGLWDFFNVERTGLSTPEEMGAHGRGWSVRELRGKGWDDLWRLWWICVRERNRAATFEAERVRLGREGGGVGTLWGGGEVTGRMKQVKKTMKSIQHVLTERWYAWENARYAAMDDPEVNLYADPDKGDVAYIPSPVKEEGEGYAEGALEDESVGMRQEASLPPPSATSKPGSEARM